MKIVLLNAKSDIPTLSQEVMGNYGMVTSVGKSPFAKLIARAKAYFENLPVLSLAYAASIFRDAGHNVIYLENKTPKDADLVIIPSSIVDYRFELKVAREVKEKTNAAVGFIGPFAALFPDIFLEGGADFVVKGEPEKGLQKLADCSEPYGLIESEKFADLDNLPFPAWEYLWDPLESTCRHASLSIL